MTTGESQIRSTSIGFGTQPEAVPTPVSGSKPWVLLVCADLGFASDSPEHIAAASWNEFFEAHKITLQGTVGKGLPSGLDALYFEISIRSMKGFAGEAMVTGCTVLRNYADVARTIDDVLQDKMAPSEAADRLRRIDIPDQHRAPLVRLLETSAPRGAVGGTSKIDSILSMLDTGEQDTAMPPGTADPGESLIAAITGGNAPQVSIEALKEHQKNFLRIIHEIEHSISTSPSFAGPHASWLMLRQLLRFIGRSASVEVFVFSRPADSAAAQFSGALRGFHNSAGATPDLVLWDFPIQFTEAGMSEVRSISETADELKSMIIASLRSNEPLVSEMAGADSARQIFHRPEMIAFCRTRKNIASRCFSICLPDILVESADRPGSGAIQAGGAWAIALEWASAITGGFSPFDLCSPDLRRRSGETAGIAFVNSPPADVAEEAGGYGLTVLRSGKGTADGKGVRTLIDPDLADKAYTLFGFNLLVNRTVRLVSSWISENSTKTDIDDATVEIHRAILSEPGSGNILSSDQALTVRNEDGRRVQVSIDSDCTIFGEPVRFQFSLDYV